jgi:anthranilate synthase/aminodeoxychorismate synthase-like glutamine amidotransferase
VPARTPTRVFVLDNHDSFTWNLVQALEAGGAQVVVAQAAGDGAAALRRAAADGVIVSPGPGAPEAAGDALATVRAAAASGLPLLGVCLGHQALAVAFGGRVRRAEIPRHGKTVPVRHDGRGLFAGLPDPFAAMLYHSLAVDEAALPPVLEVSARGPAGEVMALRHRTLPLDGVQFHPESIGTPTGAALLDNFLASCAELRAKRTASAHVEPLQSASGKRSARSSERGARSEPQASEVHQDASASALRLSEAGSAA